MPNELAEREGLLALTLQLCGVRWRGGNDLLASARLAVEPLKIASQGVLIPPYLEWLMKLKGWIVRKVMPNELAEREGLLALTLQLCGVRWRGGNDLLASARWQSNP